MHVVSNYNCVKTASINKNTHRSLSAMCFSTSYYIIITHWKHHFTLFFPLWNKHRAAALPGVGCRSVQRETGAVFASSGDKGRATIMIFESEYASGGDLITAPMSQHGWLPSAWRCFPIGRLSRLSSGPTAPLWARNVRGWFSDVCCCCNHWLCWWNRKQTATGAVCLYRKYCLFFHFCHAYLFISNPLRPHSHGCFTLALQHKIALCCLIIFGAKHRLQQTCLGLFCFNQKHVDNKLQFNTDNLEGSTEATSIISLLLSYT